MDAHGHHKTVDGVNPYKNWLYVKFGIPLCSSAPPLFQLANSIWFLLGRLMWDLSGHHKSRHAELCVGLLLWVSHRRGFRSWLPRLGQIIVSIALFFRDADLPRIYWAEDDLQSKRLFVYSVERQCLFATVRLGDSTILKWMGLFGELGTIKHLQG